MSHGAQVAGEQPYAEPGDRLVAGRDLSALLEAARADVSTVSFRSSDGNTRFNIDAVPRVIEAAEWAELETGLGQRARALNAFVADVYGARRIVAEGVVPARVIDGAANHEPALRGMAAPGGVWTGILGLDLVRAPSGRFLVLEDNAMTPSGFGYAVAARRAVAAQLDAPAHVRPRSLAELPELLRGTLDAVRPAGAEGIAVVLTDGPGNAAHWEHAWAARSIGVPLVTPAGLRSHGDRLSYDGAHVAAVYRRTNQDRLATRVGRLLEPALRAGTLGMVNAFGTGVADDKLSHAYVPDMIRFYLGEAPRLDAVPTFDLGRPEALEEVLDRLGELVVKPRDGHGGHGVVLGPLASRTELDALRRTVLEEPEAYVAQPLVTLSEHATVVGGELQPRHVDFRPFVFLHGPDDPRVLPGGLTRVALDAGAMVVNSTQNGGAKDTWVLQARGCLR